MYRRLTPVQTGVSCLSAPFLKTLLSPKQTIIGKVIFCSSGKTLRLTAIPYYISSFFTLISGVKNRGVLGRLLLNLPLDRPFTIILKDGTQFSALTLMDVWILKETILDRSYEKAGVPLQKGWTVVDIGAALGDFAVWSARQVAPGRVIAVEPFPPSLDLLNENLNLNHLDSVTVYEGAIASQIGSSRLNLVTGEAVQHSTVDNFHSNRQIAVETLTLGDLFEKYAINLCDYLKMDCEGAEYDILFKSETSLLQKVTRICMEVHDGVTVYSRADMQRFLQENGYRTRITPNPVHTNLAYLYAERQSRP